VAAIAATDPAGTAQHGQVRRKFFAALLQPMTACTV
jgi:hypothetical protein